MITKKDNLFLHVVCHLPSTRGKKLFGNMPGTNKNMLDVGSRNV